MPRAFIFVSHDQAQIPCDVGRATIAASRRSDFASGCSVIYPEGMAAIGHLQGRICAKDTLKKAENATVGKTKLLIFHDLESAARNFSVFP
jgi:hypothetical protein